MARQTRQQRRDRHAQQGQGAAGRPPAPPRRPTAAESDQQPEARRPRQTETHHRVPGVDFIRESWGELKKVEWPGQRQVITGTTVVLVACIIVGTFLWLNDQLWQYVVHHLLIR